MELSHDLREFPSTATLSAAQMQPTSLDPGPDIFQPIKPAPAYRAVSRQIERLILSGQLTAGEPLPPEQDLSDRFHVNRSTLREAIRQVEQEGLLERREGRRLFVCLPALSQLAPRTARLLMLQQTTFQELWETAVVLEPLAARLAAERATQEQLEGLHANVNATAGLTLAGEQPAHELKMLVDLDVGFHALVGHATHNRPLILSREPFSLLYGPTLFQIYGRLPQSKKRALEAHRRIVQALVQKDGEAAAAWTHKHLVDFRRGFEMAGLEMSAPIELVI